LIILASSFLQAAEIFQPECAAIESWSQTYDNSATFEPLPGWEVNALFSDDKTQNLFGKVVVAWDNADTTSLQKSLYECRKEAAAHKDTAMVKQLGTVIKETKKTYKQLRKLWSAQKAVPCEF
jgi:hypothetical protein